MIIFHEFSKNAQKSHFRHLFTKLSESLLWFYKSFTKYFRFSTCFTLCFNSILQLNRPPRCIKLDIFVINRYNTTRCRYGKSNKTEGTPPFQAVNDRLTYASARSETWQNTLAYDIQIRTNLTEKDFLCSAFLRSMQI